MDDANLAEEREQLDLGSYGQLIQELINGSVRRHVFTQEELELLFDLQMSRVRKASRPELLRRYLRAVYQQASRSNSLLRLSSFLEREMAGKTPHLPAALPAGHVA